MEFSGNFRSLMDIGGNLMLVKLSEIPKLVESGGFLKYKVDIGGNLRLIDLSEFPRFQFKVRAMCYKIFLFIIEVLQTL